MIVDRLLSFVMVAGSCAIVACSGSSGPSSSETVDSGSVDSNGTTPDTSGVDGPPAGDSGGAPDSASTSDSGSTTDSGVATDGGGASSDYATKGPHPVAKKDATLGGTAIHVLYPSDPPPAAGWPGVAFAHGFQLQATGYDVLLTHIASWGFVVVSSDYPGSLFSIDHRDVAKALSAARTAMASGTITGLPKIDASHIAAAGHSLGGKGAIMAALADAAFVAALTFDPVDGNPGNPLGGGPDAAHPQLTPTQVAALKVPVGYFGATQSHCGSTPCAPSTLDAATFHASTPASTPHYLWTIWDFGHMQFLDNPACGFTCSVCAAGKSPIDPRTTAIEATAVAFLERHVVGDATAQTWLDGAKRDAFVTSMAFWDGKSAKPACP